MDLRSVAASMAPGLMADRARSYERGFRRSTGRTHLAERLVAQEGPEVSGGPFAGLSYAGIDLSMVDAAAAKLTGTYEHDLAELFRAERHSTFVDIGCADGYYAVGAAVAESAVRIQAYDLAKSARRVCTALAKGNGVEDRVEVRGRFDLAEAERSVLESALVLVDIEGGELQLLDEPMVSAFRRSTVIVEVHEHLAPGVSRELPARFAKTHDVRRIDETPPPVPAVMSTWATHDIALALDETRPPGMHWLLAVPRLA
jgi:hypothetical protein